MWAIIDPRRKQVDAPVFKDSEIHVDESHPKYRRYGQILHKTVVGARAYPV